MASQEEVQEELRQSRLRLQAEVMRVFECRSSKVKKTKLWNEWKEKYHPHHVASLVALAKDRDAMLKVLSWNL